MIRERFPHIKALILDLDGVLWRANEPIGDLPAIFSRIAELGYRVIFCTNNSTGTAGFLHQKLLGFGVQKSIGQIVTSSMAVAHMLKKRFPQGGALFILGESGLVEPLEQAGFFHAEKDVLAVVAGLDRELTYRKLRQATTLIRAGAPFIGTNPDKTFPTPEGIIPGAGSILAALEASSGVRPEIIGKPYPALFQTALERLELPADQTLVVGDRLDTDIQGGINAGCPTALVLSGVTRREDLHAGQPQPDLVASTFADLIGE